VQVKICGITRTQDVNTALTEGADAVGFVIGSPSSPRNLPLEKAKRLMKAVQVFHAGVAVTSTRDPRMVQKICVALQPAFLQLHYYTPSLIRRLRRLQPASKLILATPISDNSSLTKAKASKRYSDAVLADSPSYTNGGGTGRVHDWRVSAMVRKAIYPHPLILAGGLTPENVRKAIRAVEPYAVDVSSGVERKVGIKDQRKVREFILNAKGAPS
jgi:phosphoribosylanthranilate isomerase